jgi:hypothetical protein
MINYDKYIETLILDGALEFSGIDSESGEILYNFTDKLKDIDPALYDDFQNYFIRHASYLWANGFISMNITDDNPIITLTEKSLDEDAVLMLEDDVKYSLKEIIRLLS